MTLANYKIISNQRAPQSIANKIEQSLINEIPPYHVTILLHSETAVIKPECCLSYLAK
jgi:hypothetical protein